LEDTDIKKIRRDTETYVNRASFSPDGAYLVTGERMVPLDMEVSGREVHIKHDDSVVVVYLDGKYLATTSYDHTIRLWFWPRTWCCRSSSRAT
jgi:hypothetical protein